MEIDVFVVVLLAAIFHATWNAFVKVDGDRLLFMTALMAIGGICALSTTLFLPIPSPESWPFILLSILLHQGYVIFLLLAYRVGDLSHVYPLARGSAPLVVAMVSISVIGESLSGYEMIAVVLMVIGIISLSFTRSAQNLHSPYAVLFALATGLFIAGYTITDGLGARVAGNPHSYASWMLGLEWIPIVLYVFWKRRATGPFRQIKSIWKPAVAMGLLSLVAYWIVIWAMTVAPIALVAALRETSIVFAVLLGVIFLKEHLSLVRLVSTFATLSGAVLIKTSQR